MQKAQRRLKTEPLDELSVVLTDDREIQALHQQHLGHAHVTDVMSFRYDPVPGVSESMTGEIVINVQRAVDEGTRRGRGWRRRPWDASRELALYLAHGCDHLTGANDDTPQKRRTMRQRELRWLAEADDAGLLDHLIM